MQKICSYDIQVRGNLEEDAFNRTSPVQICVLQADPVATSFTVRADQTGLIGLIRYLHGQGFVIMSVYRDANETIFPKEASTNE